MNKPILIDETNKYSVLKRFNKRVNKSGMNGCWVWEGPKDKGGYGTLGIKYSGRWVMYRTHRVSYRLFVGEIPDGKMVLHRCDVPACVNPEHLYIGDAKDNMRDMFERNRIATGERNGSRLHPENLAREERHGFNKHPESIPRGIRNGLAKLNDDAVRNIRIMRSNGTPTHRIAILYGVTPSTIRRAVGGATWKHIK